MIPKFKQNRAQRLKQDVYEKHKSSQSIKKTVSTIDQFLELFDKKWKTADSIPKNDQTKQLLVTLKTQLDDIKSILKRTEEEIAYLKERGTSQYEDMESFMCYMFESAQHHFHFTVEENQNHLLQFDPTN